MKIMLDFDMKIYYIINVHGRRIFNLCRYKQGGKFWELDI